MSFPGIDFGIILKVPWECACGYVDCSSQKWCCSVDGPTRARAWGISILLVFVPAMTVTQVEPWIMISFCHFGKVEWRKNLRRKTGHTCSGSSITASENSPPCPWCPLGPESFQVLCWSHHPQPTLPVIQSFSSISTLPISCATAYHHVNVYLLHSLSSQIATKQDKKA